MKIAYHLTFDWHLLSLHVEIFVNIHPLSPDTVPENSESSSGRRLPLYSNCLKIRRQMFLTKRQVRVRDFNLLSLVSAMTRDVQTAHLFMRSLKDIASFKDSCKRSLIVCTCQVEVHWSISEIRSHKHLEVLAWFPNDCSCFVMFYPLSPSFMFP